MISFIFFEVGCANIVSYTYRTFDVILIVLDISCSANRERERERERVWTRDPPHAHTLHWQPHARWTAGALAAQAFNRSAGDTLTPEECAALGLPPGIYRPHPRQGLNRAVSALIVP
jgi:hypothetical protein